MRAMTWTLRGGKATVQMVVADDFLLACNDEGPWWVHAYEDQQAAIRSALESTERHENVGFVLVGAPLAISVPDGIWAEFLMADEGVVPESLATHIEVIAWTRTDA